MDRTGLLSERLMDDALPLMFVIMLAALVVVPAVTFGIAKKWSSQQPDLGTTVLSGAVIVSIVGILSATFLALAVVGWIPPLDQLMR